MRKVVSGATAIVLVCSVFISAFGYVTFVKAQKLFSESGVSGVILLAYSYDSSFDYVTPPIVIRIVKRSQIIVFLHWNSLWY